VNDAKTDALCCACRTAVRPFQLSDPLPHLSASNTCQEFPASLAKLIFHHLEIKAVKRRFYADATFSSQEI